MSTPQQPTPKQPASGQTSQPTDGTAPGKAGQAVKALAALAVLSVAGFFIYRQLRPKPFYQFSPATMAFVDGAQSNAPLDGCDLENLQFADLDGKPVDLKQFLGKKNVVLVITRGNTSGTGAGPRYGNICLYCATQTSRLIANYPAFCDHDAEVVVVIPIKQLADRGSVDQFRQALRRTGATAEPPFPLALDVELRAVDQLGIRADLSKPATFIVDKQGQVRFAFIGATIAERPSVQSLLDQLATINADTK